MSDKNRTSNTSGQSQAANKTNSSDWSRRRILGTAAAGVGALAIGGCSGIQRTQAVKCSDYGSKVAPSPGSRVLGANDRILLGIIGSGGMGRHHIKSILDRKENNCEFIAVCDINEANRKTAVEMCGGKVKSFNEHEDLLKMKEIDGVVIASPDFWHSRHLIDSVMAGKDAYCEKPMSYSIPDGANMVKQVRRTDRIVQIGMQRRSTPSVIEAKQIVDSGFLGEVSLVRAEWYWNMGDLPKPEDMKLGKVDWERFQAPLPPEKRYPMNPVKYCFWRYFWEYSGGNMTDQGTHLMDVIQWLFNDSKPPVAAQEHGAAYQIKGYETPDTFCAVFEYPKFMATWTLTYTNNWHDAWSIIAHGRKGTLEIDDKGARFYKEKWPANWEEYPPEPEHEISSPLRVDLHEANWLECMRTRKQPNAPVEIGHQAVSALHLANAAHHAKKRATLDPDGMTVRIP
ncbi:MAG: Gfo/Idh/MocA family oxidoreductase [Planctomycetes bacterium]|nr:Gfo/Idh/MocA family oxidoreductase [Planctomycetota bacterium]